MPTASTVPSNATTSSAMAPLGAGSAGASGLRDLIAQLSGQLAEEIKRRESEEAELEMRAMEIQKSNMLNCRSCTKSFALRLPDKISSCRDCVRKPECALVRAATGHEMDLKRML